MIIGDFNIEDYDIIDQNIIQKSKYQIHDLPSVLSDIVLDYCSLHYTTIPIINFVGSDLNLDFYFKKF